MKNATRLLGHSEFDDSRQSCKFQWLIGFLAVTLLSFISVSNATAKTSTPTWLASSTKVPSGVAIAFADTCNIPLFVSDTLVNCGCPPGFNGESKIIQYCDPNDPGADPKSFRVSYCISRYPDAAPVVIRPLGWKCVVQAPPVAFNAWVKITGFCATDANFTLDSMQKYLFCKLDMCQGNFFFPQGVTDTTGWSANDRSCVALSIPKCWEALPWHPTNGYCYLSCNLDEAMCCNYWLQAQRGEEFCHMQMLRYCTTEEEECPADNPNNGRPCLRLECFDPCVVPWHCCFTP